MQLFLKMKNYLVPSVAEAIVAFPPVFGYDFIVDNERQCTCKSCREAFLGLPIHREY